MIFARRTAISIALLLVAVGCSGDPQEPGATATVPHDQHTRDGGVATAPFAAEASAEQLSYLADGEVTFEECEAAIAASLACLEDAGFDVIGPTPDDSRGFRELWYTYSGTAPGLDEQQGEEVSTACLNEHSRTAEMTYQTQPSSVEAMDALFEDYRAVLIACLETHGAPVDGDASRSELETAVAGLLMAGGADCFREVDDPL